MKKNKWYLWEEIVKEHYQWKGYNLLKKNYTIKWGEIDLIFDDENTIVFVEVKVIDWIEDLFDYISQNKLKFLSKTIIYYLNKFPSNKMYRLDVVFVKNQKIYEIYENVEVQT